MKSKSISLWEKMIENASKSYKDYFNFEKEYLSKKLDNKDVVLDLGTGDGRTMSYFLNKVQKFIGIDNDPKAVEDANNNLRKSKNLEVICMDAEKMSFKSNLFDKVFCGLTLCNFAESKYDVLKETKRVLKDNGRFVFSVYNENALEERLKMYNKYVEECFEVYSDGTVYLPKLDVVSEQFSQEQLENLMKETGFKIEEIHKGEIFYMMNCSKI